MQPNTDPNPTQSIDQSISSIIEKMKLINYNNFEPPYFLHTLTKFRETYFSKFLKDVKIQGENDQEIRKKLKTVHYIIEKFDDESFDIYASQLVQPYMRKMFNDNYQFDNIQFKEINTQYHLQSQIEETLSQAAEWLSQIQVTQDLLARVQLYFKLKTPNIIQKVRLEGLQSQRSTWTGAFMSGVKKLLSFGLRKGSKMVTSTFFTAVAPAALMLSLAIMGGSISLPWKTTMTPKNLISAAAVVAVPIILDSLADTVERSDYRVKLKNWALTFETLAESIRKFNDNLEQSIRNVTLSANVSQFTKQRTNLQKIVSELNRNIQSITCFNEEKFEQMRERTEAYFRQYIEIKEGDWTLVLPKHEGSTNTKNDKERETADSIDQKSAQEKSQKHNLKKESQNQEFVKL